MRLFGAIAAAALLALTPSPTAAQSPVGEVAFENSGAPAAQASFLRGLALLHNFEYPRAAAAFREAQAAIPNFAMAYWGEAMTYNHPVWMEQDADRARAVLARLGPDRSSRLARAPTDRERAYLEAVETLYGEGSKEGRDRAYSARMAALHQRHPDDVDATAFYALSLLGLAHQGRDYSLYMRSAALLEEVFPRNSRHPGVVHYLIHSYDDPVHAPLGLRAARLYAAIAPDAPHAIHMTSHIYIAMGMWDEVIAANRASIEAAVRLQAAAGRPTPGCGHAREWLFYALHQKERRAEAGALADACLSTAREELAAAPTAASNDLRWPRLGSYADMQVRQVVETGERRSYHGFDPSDERYPGPNFTLAYADLLAAGSDLARLRAARSRLEELGRVLAEVQARRGATDPSMSRRQAIILAQAAGLEKLRAGDSEGGLADLWRAAELERATPVEFGPPFVEKPSHELIGDELLRLRRFAEALQAYQSALAPGRRLSLRGLQRAEEGLSR
jgi:tetratricopeptide (TPR) repeat protein